MRTGTKCFVGGSSGEFVKIFKNYYPAGKLAIICEDKKEGEGIARALGSDYNVLLYGADKETVLPSGARFVIGVGGIRVIPAVKRAAKNAKYAFIPAVMDFKFLYNFDGEFTLPEFVFLSDEATSEKSNYCQRIYESVFQLYSEYVFRLYYAGALPYADEKSEIYKNAAERILRGRARKEEFFDDGIRFITDAVNNLYRERTKTLITDRVSSMYGARVGEKFLCSYFLILMLKNFTKRSIRDILLPSQKAVAGVKSAENYAFDESALPTDEELKSYYAKMSFLTDIPEPDVSALISCLEASASADCPIFAIINNKGITGALSYEKSQRSICLSV